MMARSDDEWGRDPSVRFLRRVFCRIESDQKKLLDRLQVAPFDSRLRPWREAALRLFERAWAVATRKGLAPDEKGAALVYLECLARTLRSNGVDVPAESIPYDEGISKIFEEDPS
jgi:hypothetical protein